MRFSAASGIAIAPILFVVALLAILATAIAAGSGSFSSGTDSEKARVMAGQIVSVCQQYQTALARLSALGCDVTKVDYTPTAWPAGLTWSGGDFTGGNGTNRAGNGSCSLFDVRGGGLNWQKLPREALADNPSGGYSSAGWSAAQKSNFDILAGYPLFSGRRCFGSKCDIDAYNNNGSIVMYLTYIKRDVCESINKINRSNINPDSATVTPFAHMSSFMVGGVIVTNGYTGGRSYIFSSASTLPDMQGCARDQYSNGGNSVYQYVCVLMVR